MCWGGQVMIHFFGTSVWGYVILGVIALGGLFVFVFCFGSLIFLIIRAFKRIVGDVNIRL